MLPGTPLLYYTGKKCEHMVIYFSTEHSRVWHAPGPDGDLSGLFVHCFNGEERVEIPSHFLKYIDGHPIPRDVHNTAIYKWQDLVPTALELEAGIMLSTGNIVARVNILLGQYDTWKKLYGIE